MSFEFHSRTTRRDFALQLGLGCAALALAQSAAAQAPPVEGKDYVRLAQPLAMPAGVPVEVIFFFGYWCPHCNAFESVLDPWAKKLPPEVSFKRVPVAFAAVHEPYQRLYYALEAMGQVEAMNRKVFAAIHVQKQRLDKDADIVAYVSANGIDGAKFGDTMKSFSVQTRVRQAKQLAEAYKIDGVPTLGIHGRYFTSPSLTQSQERALLVADYLVQRVRKG
jgi:protein dithiol oxidoreductase (disulfide-forming)